MSSRISAYGFLQGLHDWWSERRADLGLVGALKQFVRESCEFLRDCTPERKRARYGDIDYDCEYRVNTTEAAVSTRTRLLGTMAGSLYQPSEPQIFHEMMSALPINHRQFTFIDIGSGKGRTLLMASDYPFARVLGIELFPELHEIAQENIRNYESENQKAFRIESQCINAREFTFPPTPVVVYLFNPLPRSGLSAVIGNLERSLRDHPREAFVVYHNPEHRKLLERSSLRKFMQCEQYVIYRAVN